MLDRLNTSSMATFKMRSSPVFGGCWHVTWDIESRLCIFVTSLILSTKIILGIVIAIKRWTNESRVPSLQKCILSYFIKTVLKLDLRPIGSHFRHTRKQILDHRQRNETC